MAIANIEMQPSDLIYDRTLTECVLQLQKTIGFPMQDSARGQDGMLGDHTLDQLERFKALTKAKKNVAAESEQTGNALTDQVVENATRVAVEPSPATQSRFTHPQQFKDPYNFQNPRKATVSPEITERTPEVTEVALTTAESDITPETTEESIEMAPSAVEIKHPEEMAIIGDSLMWGLDWQTEGNPSYIGGEGYTSAQVLSALQAHREDLTGKQIAVISVGGNDAANKIPVGTILKNIKAMVTICREAKIPKIIVLTRPPHGEGFFESRYARLGKNDPMEGTVMATREEISKEFDNPGDYPDVQVVDMFGAMATSQGTMPPQWIYKKDNMHPSMDGYCEMLEILAEEVPGLSNLNEWIRYDRTFKSNRAYV